MIATQEPITAAPTSTLEYESGRWDCPITGSVVPKRPGEYERWRVNLLKECMDNPAAQAYVSDLCKRSLTFFVNAFGWTVKFKQVDQEGRETGVEQAYVPFNTYPCQDVALAELQTHIPREPGDPGGDVLIDKSREMGASWLLVATTVWLWLFYPNSRTILTSRIEDLVDKSGDPLSLYWKVDRFIEYLPPWMLPAPIEKLRKGGEHRQHMQLTNPVNGATVSGEATTEHIGRGDRANWIVFDEMSAMPTADPAWRSAADATACRAGNATPLGAGTKYSKLYFDGLKTEQPRVIGLYYYDHPEKGRDREWRIDHDGSVTNEAGRGYWWTPWLENQKKRRDPQDMAQNVLADHISSGSSFFSTRAVSKHIQKHAIEPNRYEFDQDKGVFVEAPGTGRWYVWCELDEDGKPVDQNTNFVIFADPSYGTGQANAAIEVMNTETGEFVAEYADPYTPPQDLTGIMMDAGLKLFPGQAGAAFIGWELNGPGEAMHFDFKDKSYPLVYYNRQVETKTNRRTKVYGWRSTNSRKRILCSQLDKAIVREEVTIHSRAALNEMIEYVIYDNGSIGLSGLADEQSGAREAHGDRAIGCAGCVLLRAEAPKFIQEHWQYPAGSLGDVHKRAIEKRRKAAFSW